MRMFGTLGALALLLAGCDGETATPTNDRDGDGASFADDCDDGDATRYPGATERCDGYDEDCDGAVDDDAEDALTWYDDADGDGFGVDETARVECVAPRGAVVDGGDCDDEDPAINPAARETCDDRDEDCDGTIDEDAIGSITVHADTDGDGYGDPDVLNEGCEPEGVEDGTDCDDADGTAFPGAEELCDGVDTDCDGLLDVGATDGTTWFTDADGDGYGDYADPGVVDCSADGRATNSFDCDDADSATNPAGGGCSLTGEVSATTAGLTVLGGAGQALGTAVAMADLDEDGLGELLVGAPDSGSGALYVWEAPLTGAESTTRFTGKRAGTTRGQSFGASIAIGDIDGDGVPDVVAGSPDETTEGASAGAAWIFSGAIEGEARTTSGIALYAEGPYDEFGRSAAVLDANGDGTNDLLIGAPEYQNKGRAYLITGPVTATPDLTLATATFEGVGSNDRAGAKVGGGDLDGDGVMELAVAAPDQRQIYLFAGGSTGSVSADAADLSIGGRGYPYYVGMDFAFVDDADGDGLGDLLIGGPTYVGGAPSYAGEAWLLAKPTTDVDLPEDAVATFTGEASGDQVGYRVGGGVDLDGDGVSELLVSLMGSDRAATNAGAVGVFPGSVSGTVTLDDATAILLGGAEDTQLGSAIAAADLDGDGWPEVAVGARNDPTGGEDAGAAYLFVGGVP